MVATAVVSRHLLAVVTGTLPGSWRLGRQPDGAPYASCNQDCPAPPRLSLSRTAGAIAVAVSTEGAVGVDIERLDAAPDGARVAQALFAPVDHATLGRAQDAGDAFIALWTLKEAVLKALGVGLSLPPDHVGVLALDPPRIGFRSDGFLDARDWQLWHASRGPFRAAVAARGGTGDGGSIEVRWVAPAPYPGLGFEPID